jgi:hypothetical protein
LINGSIQSSFGIDLMELELDPSNAGKPVRLILSGTSTPQDAFHVELRGLRIGQDASEIEPAFAQARILGDARTHNSLLILDISGQDTQALDGIGVIITRLDPHEDTGSQGNYVLQWITE